MDEQSNYERSNLPPIKNEFHKVSGSYNYLNFYQTYKAKHGIKKQSLQKYPYLKGNIAASIGTKLNMQGGFGGASNLVYAKGDYVSPYS